MIFTDDEIREIYEREYKQGVSIRKLAHRHKCNMSTLVLRFRALGLEQFPVWRFMAIVQPEDMPTICEMRRQGKTYNEIAQHYYCDQETIRDAFKRYNVPKIGRTRK